MAPTIKKNDKQDLSHHIESIFPVAKIEWVKLFYQLGDERDGLSSRSDVRHAVDVAVEGIVSGVPASKR